MKPKPLILILGVLITIFFLSTSWGLLSDDASVGKTAEAIVNMIRGLQDQAKEPLAQADVVGTSSADCREQLGRRRFVLSRGESCRIDVRKSSVPVRTLTVVHQEGPPVELAMKAEDGDREQKETIPLDEGDEPERLEVQFMREGARLLLRCTRQPSLQNRCVVTTPSL